MSTVLLVYFFGALALSLVCSTLADWLAYTVGAEIEGRFGISVAACFVPTVVPLLAYGNFGVTDALGLLASLLAASLVFWWFRRAQSRAVNVNRPRVSQ